MEIELFRNETISLTSMGDTDGFDVTLTDTTVVSKSTSRWTSKIVRATTAMVEALKAVGLFTEAEVSYLQVVLFIGFSSVPGPRATIGYLNASICNPEILTSRGLASNGDNRINVTVDLIRRSDQFWEIDFIPADHAYSFKVSRPKGHTRQRFEISSTDSTSGLDKEWDPALWTSPDFPKWEVICSAKLILSNGPGQDSFHPIDPLVSTRRILTEELHCDVVVIAENKSEVKFHRSFLSAQSSVFNAMFQSGMTEARTGIVEMPDVTEEGVRALREYLYLGKLEGALEKSEICWELLEVGHKYDIQALEKSMERILLQKPPEWYAVDVALRLFLIARGSGGGERLELKKKAVRALKAKYDDLQGLSSYEELYKKNIDAVKDLCESLAKLSN